MHTNPVDQRVLRSRHVRVVSESRRAEVANEIIILNSKDERTDENNQNSSRITHPLENEECQSNRQQCTSIGPQIPIHFRRRLNCATGVEATRELRRSARVALELKWRSIGNELRLISEQFSRGKRTADRSNAQLARTNANHRAHEWSIRVPMAFVVVLMSCVASCALVIDR